MSERRFKKQWIGQKLGLITIQSYNCDTQKYTCECSCGQICYKSWRQIRKRLETESCGCNRRYGLNKNYNWKGYGEISGNMFSELKRGAKERNLEFKISIEYIWELFLKQNRKCALTGQYLYFPKTSRQRKGGNASLDRIDSKVGYLEGNLQWVSKDINYLKKNFSESSLIFLAQKITQHSTQPKLLLYNDLKTTCEQLRNNNKIITLVSMPGDLIHSGHISYLKESSKLGDILVVIVNGNSFLLRKKGYYALDSHTRALIISELRYVDYVAVFDDDSQHVARAILELKPHIFPNGGDRKDDSTAPTEELEACEIVGTKRMYGIGGFTKQESSSKIIQNILKQKPIGELHQFSEKIHKLDQHLR